MCSLGNLLGVTEGFWGTMVFSSTRTLHQAVVVKRELICQAKLSINQWSHIPALTYGHELWVVTERMALWIYRVARLKLMRIMRWSSSI